MTVKGTVKFFNETKGFPIASAVLGTTYGNPGGGNFAMPDLRGRFFFNLDAGGSGRITSAGGNFDGTVLGNTGGAQNRTIAQANLPNVSFPVSGITLSDPTHNHTVITSVATVGGGFSGGLNVGNAAGSNTTTSNATGIAVATQGGAASGGSGASLAMLPPSMGINCMMRIA